MQSNPEDELGAKDPLRQYYAAVKAQADRLAEAADYEQAQKCYDEAAVLAPDEPAPYVGLGIVYLQTGQLDKAEWAFRFARRIRPACAEAYAGLAMVHQRRQAFPEAFETYLKCLELDSDNLVALLGLFQTSCQMGTFARITQYLERYLRMHPDDTAVLFCLATLYARDGRLPAAREALVKVLKLEPDKAEAARLLEAIERRSAADPLEAARHDGPLESAAG